MYLCLFLLILFLLILFLSLVLPSMGGLLREFLVLPAATWLLPGLFFLSPRLECFAKDGFLSAFSSFASIDWIFFRSTLVSSSLSVLILLTVRAVRSTIRPPSTLGVTEHSLTRMEAMRSALSLSTVNVVAFFCPLVGFNSDDLAAEDLNCEWDSLH